MSLLLMRHAKSSWAEAGLADHDRPLNARGLRDAPRMALWLRKRDLVPARIFCSSALRAQETAAAMQEVLELPAPTILPQLYEATVETWQKLLEEHTGPECSLWIGHNPAIELLTSLVAGEMETMPTAAIAQLQRRNNHPGGFVEQWKLVEIHRPKEIGD